MISRKTKKVKRKAKTPPLPVVDIKKFGTKKLMPATERNNIRNWRLFRGIKSQQALAQLTFGIKGMEALTRATLCRLESGNLRYREDQLDVLSIVLKCTPTDLIGVNPFRSGDIFLIYRGLPAAKQAQIDKLASTLNASK